MHSPQHRSQGRPFLAAPRPSFYFPANVVESAREELERGVRRAEGVGVVIGQAGTGKSLLLAKLADDLRDDFDVAFLSGARICTRRALWQSVLADIGESYRGLEEGDLRMSVIERVRGLAATCSGLVVLVDEAQTLPTRLVEELRLLSTVQTPMPAVHLVFAGTRELEERLANPKLESLSQRIVVRTVLEPLDHAETCSYVRSQCRQAGLDWESRFETGCDDALFSITDGVPRLINQICDHALLAAGETKRLRPADIEAAWREIQRLPSPDSLTFADQPTAAEPQVPPQPTAEPATISFGSLDDSGWPDDDWGDAHSPLADTEAEVRADGPHRLTGGREPAADTSPQTGSPAIDPFHGPDVEFFFDASQDPFDELFEDEAGAAVERHLAQGPDDFGSCQQVTNRQGGGLADDLAACEEFGDEAAVQRGMGQHDPLPQDAEWESDQSPSPRASATTADHEDAPSEWEAAEERSWQDQYEYRPDGLSDADPLEPADLQESSLYDEDGDRLDADVIVVEEDLVDDPEEAERSVFAVRPADYRRLFARLRRQ